MKKTILFISLFIVSVMIGRAQNSLMANYPLTENGEDVSGQNETMLLKNILFENGGIYSNGIYAGDDTTGSQILTPPFPTFDYNNFTVLLDFKIDFLPENRQAIIIGGLLWRWIGAYIDNGNIAFMANDFTIYDISDIKVPVNQWNTLRFSYDINIGNCYFYFNNVLVSTYSINEFNSGDDPRFGNAHTGQGDTFKGYWRNLIFHNAASPDGIPLTSSFKNITVSIQNNNLFIDLPSNLKKVNITITDMQGRIVKTAELNSGTNTISLSSTPKMYLVILHSSTGKKLVTKITTF